MTDQERRRLKSDQVIKETRELRQRLAAFAGRLDDAVAELRKEVVRRGDSKGECSG